MENKSLVSAIQEQTAVLKELLTETKRMSRALSQLKVEME